MLAPLVAGTFFGVMAVCGLLTGACAIESVAVDFITVNGLILVVLEHESKPRVGGCVLNYFVRGGHLRKDNLKDGDLCGAICGGIQVFGTFAATAHVYCPAGVERGMR